MCRPPLATLLVSWLLTSGAGYEDPGLEEAAGLQHYMHWQHYLPDCQPADPDAPSEFDLVCSQRSAPPSAVRVACVGDSITAVGHTSSKAHQYPSQLQALLDHKKGVGKYSVTNLGCCGTTLRKGGASPYWTSAQYKALTASRWDVVIIMLGTNDARDISSGGPEHWPSACDSATAETLSRCEFANDYQALLDVVKGLGRASALPEVYIMVPPPLMQQGAYAMNQTIINSVLPRLIPLIAGANHQIVRGVIDVFSGMGGEPDWKEKFPPKCSLNSSWAPCKWYCDAQSCNPGQCHPNDSGCAHLARVVEQGWLGGRSGGASPTRAFRQLSGAPDTEPAVELV